MDYEKIYKMLFTANTGAIKILQKSQQTTEDICIESKEDNEQSYLKPDKKSDQTYPTQLISLNENNQNHLINTYLGNVNHISYNDS